MAIVRKTHFDVVGPMPTNDLKDALRRGLEYDKSHGVVVGMRDRDVGGCGTQGVQGLGGNIVEFDGGFAGRMAAGLDVPPENAATHPRAQRFHGSFLDGEPGRQMSFRTAARKAVFQFAGSEHPFQKPFAIPFDGPAYPGYLDNVYSRTDYHMLNLVPAVSRRPSS